MGEQREPDEDGDGQTAPDPRGGDGTAHRPAGDLPHDGAEHPAAVQGQAGQQVERGDDEVGDHQSGEQHAGHGARLDELQGDEEESAQHEREQGAHEGEDELTPRGLGLLLDLRDTAEELELDPADRQLVAQGDDGVGELVDEHGGVEGDREEEGHQVARGAEPRQHAVELAPEHPGDQGGDDEPAGRHVDGYAEGAAHEDAAAGVLGAVRSALVRPGAGVAAPRAGLRAPAVAALVHVVPSVGGARRTSAVRELCGRW